VTDLLQAVTEQVAEAVALHNQGEDVEYAVSLGVMPGADHQPMPVLVLALTIPSVVIGHRLSAMNVNQNLMVEPTTPEVIRQMIEQMIQARSELMKHPPEPPAHLPNGEGIPQGLIDPTQRGLHGGL
jgi:hypothetical protein